MDRAFVRLLADIAILMVVILLPYMYVLFSDRFRRPLSAEQWALLFGVTALAGVLLFLPAISVIAATGLLALGLAWLSGRYALSGVSYTHTIEPRRLFPGDVADLTVRLNNRKVLPLSWISVTDPIQYTSVRNDEHLAHLLRFSGGIVTTDELGNALLNRTAVGPYQSVARTYKVEALHRGTFRLGPALVETGDPFGIFRKEILLGGRLEILVYPRIFTADEVELPFRQVMGDLAAKRALFEDPILLAGSRQYRPGDPLNRMHWKATARTQDLQVRVADPSTTAQLMLLINLNTFQHVWQGVDLERMEAAISVAASLGLWALEEGYAVGVRSNGLIQAAEHMENAPRLAPSASVRQSAVLLEHMARLAFSGRIPPENVLFDEARRMEAGTSLVFITPTISKELVAALTSRQLANRVTVVYCGRFAAPVIRGLPIHLVTPPLEGIRAVS